MKTLRQNVRYSFRLLRKNPGFTLIAAVTLALGIGANTAIFSVIYAVLLAPMPYPNPDQLVMVWSRIQGNRNVVSAGDYLDWKRQNKAFQDINAWSGANFNFATADQPEQINGSSETPGFLHMTGNDFFLGRDFLPEEGEVGKDRVVVLTHRLWEHLGGDRNIIGKQIRMNSEPYTVVGVLAAGQADRLQSQFVVPLAFKPEQLNHDFHWLLVMGRVKPGVSLAQAQADMEVVTGRIAQDNPQSNEGWGASVELLHNDFFPKEARLTLWLLMGGVGFVLLIACANVANLLLAKGTTRIKEVAVRTSLGATRWHVFSQFLTESLMLAVLGGGLGIALGVAMIRAMLAKMPPFTLPSEADVGLNVPVLLFTLAATTIAGVLFGCAPAWHASRVDPNETLKEGGRSGTSAGRNRLRRSLVVAEFALALTLLAGAGLAIHSFWNLAKVDLGVRTDHVLTFSLPVPQAKLTQSGQMVSFYQQLLERVESLPGVSHAEVATGMPLQGPGFGMPFTIAGKPVSDPSTRPGAGFEMVTPGYFQTFGIQMVKGRGFTEQDIAGRVRVAVVNEALVKKYFPDVDPLTQRLIVEDLIPGVTKLGPPVEWQIVGVVRNVRNGIRNDGFPEIDVPFWQSPWPQVGMAVRTTGDPIAMSKSIAAAVHSLDPDLALANVKPMDQLRDESLVTDRFTSLLYVSFAGVALLLATIGIYGVMAFAVAQRTHEIGLRMALGASRDHVLGLILKEGIMLAAIGLGLGLVGACFVGRAMRGLLYGVGTIDVAAFSVVAAAMLAAALVACYVPANKAAKVDPMVALRYE
jgi:putative ABC transport system permease protein